MVLPARKALSSTVLEIAGYGEFVEIGSGGYSHVYRARQYEFERPVAIKVLNKPLKDEDAVRAFERECRTMGALWDHPNIVPVFASAFTSDDRPCIVMKLFQEGSYAQVLSKSGRIALEELLLVGMRIAGALAAAHEAGVVHGDVKPHNIFKSKFGEPALGDFGIATFVGRQTENAPRGLSVHYAAPESVEGGPGPAADQYSLAATLYTMALGKRPFESTDSTGSDSSTQVQVLLRVLEAPTPRLPDRFPQEFSDVIWRAMARDPDRRYSDVSAFGDALADVEHGLGLRRPARATKAMPRQHRPTAPGEDPERAGIEVPGGSRSGSGGSTTAEQQVRSPTTSKAASGAGLASAAAAVSPRASRNAVDDLGATGSGENTAARTVEARVCLGCDRPHPPLATVCLSCDEALDERTSQTKEVPQPQLGTLRLSGGRVEVLDADLVIGRNPVQEPLEAYQRPVVHGEDDRTISRRHIELRLNGWNLTALVSGRHARLKRRGSISVIDEDHAVDLVLGDTLYFGTGSWLRYISNDYSPNTRRPIAAAGSQADSDHQVSPLGSDNDSLSDSDVASSPTSSIDPLLQSGVGTVHFSDGGKETLDADLVIGRNPVREPLASHQRAVVHGGDDRTISRRHLELKLKGTRLIALCLGKMIRLERDGAFRELSSGSIEQLEPGDTLHYGVSSWLRYDNEIKNGKTTMGIVTHGLR